MACVNRGHGVQFVVQGMFGLGRAVERSGMATVDLQGGLAIFVHARIICIISSARAGQPYADMVRQFFGQFCQYAPAFFSLFVGEQGFGQITCGFGIVPEGKCFAETTYGIFDLPILQTRTPSYFSTLKIPLAAFLGFSSGTLPGAEQCFLEIPFYSRFFCAQIY